MEVVNEYDEADDLPRDAAVLEDERYRMQQNVQKAAHGQRIVGSPEGLRGLSRKPSVQRGQSGTLNGMRGGSRPGSLPMRSQSMRAAVRPLAPTKSTDHLASMRASRAQRGNISRVAPVRSQSSILGAPHRAPPDRTSSVDSTNSLLAFRRDQMGGSSLEPGTMELQRLRGDPGALTRNPSDMSNLTAMTGGDLSCFTMDSVNLRKAQLVADPIFTDDGTYNEEDSYADHESVSRASIFSEYTPGAARIPPEPRLGVHRTPSRLGAIRVVEHRPHPAQPKEDESSSGEEEGNDDDERSFGSVSSGLTQDFTGDDFLYDSESEDHHEASASEG